MSTSIGSALSETADKLRFINQLVTENKFVEAKAELDKLAAVVEQHPGSVVAGEYYYFCAVVEFNSKPHLEVLDLARKAYAIVSRRRRQSADRQDSGVDRQAVCRAGRFEFG